MFLKWRQRDTKEWKRTSVDLVCVLWSFFLSKTSNESTDFDDPQVVHDSQFFDDPKLNSNGSMDFDNSKVYGYISILDGFVLLAA